MALFDSYLAMVDRSVALSETGDGFRLIEPDAVRNNRRGFLKVLDDWSQGRNLPANFVRQTTRWLIQDGVVVGEARLRHELSPALEVEGGHIGYFIHADHRGRGFGTLILKLALIELKGFGVDRVLVTCDADNVRSRRVIERNGGVFRRETISPRSGKPVTTFWIS